MIRVAAIQYKPHKLNPQKSREELAVFIEDAAKEKVLQIISMLLDLMHQ